MQSWKETKALYRLLGEPDVTFAALIQPHTQQTREQANRSKVTLLVQDTTDIDLSHRHQKRARKPLPSGMGRNCPLYATGMRGRQVAGCQPACLVLLHRRNLHSYSTTLQVSETML
jgi:hypothetical protein